ncbi:MAG: HAD-IB family phosphatase [Candidatus Diapherotrites archaeon]
MNSCKKAEKSAGIAFFDLDKTLIRESSIEAISKRFGFFRELKKLRAKLKKGKIKDFQITLSLAEILKGRKKSEITAACKKIHLQKNAKKTIHGLKKKGFEIAIVSVAFSPVVRFFAKKFGVKIAASPMLESDAKGIFNGKVLPKKRHSGSCCGNFICKSREAKKLMKKLKIGRNNCIAVGDGTSDKCLFRACGKAFALNPKVRIGGKKIRDLIEVLRFV